MRAEKGISFCDEVVLGAPRINLLRREPDPHRGAVERLRAQFQMAYRVMDTAGRWEICKMEPALKMLEQQARCSTGGPR